MEGKEGEGEAERNEGIEEREKDEWGFGSTHTELAEAYEFRNDIGIGDNTSVI